MASIFEEIRILKEEGRLHATLLRSVRMLFILSGIILLVILYNALFRQFGGYFLMFGGMLAVVGYILGFFLFSKMSAVNWNEEEEVVQSKKMDKAGYLILALYVVFEISLRTFLKNTFSINIVPLLLCGIVGTLFGRALGTLFKIHKVYLSR